MATTIRVAELGIQPHVIEAILNQVSGHKASVAGIYHCARCAAERKQALELWSEPFATLSQNGILDIASVTCQ